MRTCSLKSWNWRSETWLKADRGKISSEGCSYASYVSIHSIQFLFTLKSPKHQLDPRTRKTLQTLHHPAPNSTRAPARPPTNTRTPSIPRLHPKRRLLRLARMGHRVPPHQTRPAAAQIPVTPRRHHRRNPRFAPRQGEPPSGAYANRGDRKERQRRPASRRSGQRRLDEEEQQQQQL